MQTIVPVLLCGGSGMRLWPLSRKSYPKQFMPVVGDRTLFQASAQRVTGGTDAIRFAAPMVLTNVDFRFIVGEQLLSVGIDPGAILIEPVARNTAPAILAATIRAAETDEDAILLVSPSDHLVPDTAAFHDAVVHGLSAVAEGKIVTFGIPPTYAETAYGYLELPDVPEADCRPVPLGRFVEKPDTAQAQEFLEAGNYLWNAGFFMFRAGDMLSTVEAHAPDLMAPVQKAVEEAAADLGFLRLAPEPWAQAEDISIDYAVMEKADNLAVVTLRTGWSDLGGWNAVWRESGPDGNGVVASDHATAIDCSNTLLRSESEQLEIVGIGLDNIMAIAMPDAVLVADMSRAQDVKKAVAALKEKGADQAVSFPIVHRPWGWFESLVIGNRFQVKRILVHPGASLSLQRHFHRSEHWIVVEGTARVTIDGKVSLVTENESLYIPIGSVHRMENPGKIPMVLIEVQTGAYVGEDDIVRYEDDYARC